MIFNFSLFSFSAQSTRRCRRLVSLAALLSAASVNSHAQSPSIPVFQQEEFEQCKAALKQQAQQHGVTSEQVLQSLSQVQHDHKVIEYDRRQPEFSESFGSYFNKRVNSWRVDKGRKMLAEHKKLLAKLHKSYGIPPQYLIAFWGLETNFGSYKGKMSVIRSLVTLACDQRRQAFFTGELITALKLAQREQLAPEQMLGSWAGAMGHTQFMPSAYMQYAVDGDGDGKVNLWESVDDALTSAANFLHHLGWKPGFRWGREVVLDEKFAYQHSGVGKPKTMNAWRELGVVKTDGSAVDKLDIKASLIVPAGYKGPAFLVYDNFSVIMRWNYSEFYALAVGHLADRLAGGGQLHRPPVKTANLTLAQLMSLQLKLTELGFDVGKADGILGPATKKGIRAFQSSRKMIADGFPHQDLLTTLDIEL
ncbi:lytic murein transglycosylase [Thalassomonas viridans]|uniref:Lytic murein transglycosylase n=1 Tax=Thalassomonas viridans TaxID=137584 RepID=A0AAE9Z9H8_9GAMM|nr:lytic murein transglycosylase [Thalassomonas viridans]WDE08510.1 lytic murein transglycosylase [Thalassomonas viridans]